MKRLLKDKEFFSVIIALIIPIALQNLISSSLNMVDNMMIGKLGENSIAAVGLVNQYFFIFMLSLSGINAGASIFMSQFWGKKDISNIKKMLGLDLVISIIASIIFSIAAILFPESIMKVFTKDVAVIDLGVKYIRIIGITFIMTAITQAYSTALRCTEKPNEPMVASFIGVVLNAFLNWVLIFGNLGLPAMGVQGAAIATGIARLVEMIYVVICAYKKDSYISTTLKEMLNFNSNFVKIYFQTSSSVIINELIWSLGLTTYSIIYAKIGISAVASMQIATTINNVFMVLCTGLAAAAAIIIGNKIGAKDEELAVEYATKLGILAPLMGLVIGIALWITSPIIAKAFNIGQETLDLTIIVLKTMALFAPLRFFNVVMIVGVFRGGGDTTYSMLVQLGTVWSFAIPAGFIAAVYFKLPLDKVYFIICLEEVVKIFFEAKRLKSRKWVRNVVDNTETSNITA